MGKKKRMPLRFGDKSTKGTQGKREQSDRGTAARLGTTDWGPWNHDTIPTDQKENSVWKKKKSKAEKVSVIGGWQK